MGSSSILRLKVFLLCLVSLVTADDSLFLLAGQSNMIGWSSGVLSVEGNDSLFTDTIKILEAPFLPDSKRHSLLYDRFLRAALLYPRAQDPISVAIAQADGVMSLFQQNLTVDLTSELSGAYCSWTDTSLTAKKQVVNSTGCGSRFGHELSFSHRLKQSDFYGNEDFYSVKVAKGGTRIQEWVPDGGQYWQYLRSAIHDTPGDWKLIVWHQGENDAIALASTINTKIYFDHLKDLISTLRSEMFMKSPGAFKCPDEIPVIIVRIHYPNKSVPFFAEPAKEVRRAQTRFCKEDPRARLVLVEDLDEFFHLSAPSLLISGNRIAEAYLEMLGSDFTCPQT